MGPWTGTVVFFFSGIAQKSRRKKKGRGMGRKKKKGCWSCRFSTDTHFARGRRDDKTIIATLNKGNVRSWRKPHVSLKHCGFLTNLRSHTLPMSQDFIFFFCIHHLTFTLSREAVRKRRPLFLAFFFQAYIFLLILFNMLIKFFMCISYFLSSI
jgi:hypothetical protein